MKPINDLKVSGLVLALLLMLLMTSLLLMVTTTEAGTEQADPTNLSRRDVAQTLATPIAAPSGETEVPKTLPDFVAVKAQAVERGSVSVIVGLKVQWQPSGKMPIALVQAQEVNIAQAQDQLLAALEPDSVVVLSRYTFIPAMALRVNTEALEQIEQSPDVAYIRENTLLRPTLRESIPLIGADRAWSLGFAGAGQTVAILDTGVDGNHPFLQAKIVSEACYSTTDQGSHSTTVCPNGHRSQIGAGAGRNCGITGCEHGTHVAGIAAGNLNGIAGRIMGGVAPDANIIAIQVFSRLDDPPLCGGLGQPDCVCHGGSSPCISAWDNNVIEGLDRVFDLRNNLTIAAVNLSLGGVLYDSECDTSFPAYRDAIATLNSAGIAVVVASGNDGDSSHISHPACLSNAISVGSTTDANFGSVVIDSVSTFTNIASTLDLFAPGQIISSSVPGGGWQNMVGTSMAAPHVTGAFAVMRQRNPNATIDTIWTALECTGRSIRDNRSNLIRSRIQVDAALDAVSNGVTNVDRAFSGREDGSRSRPFNTVAEGVNAVGQRGYVAIRAGNYNETMTINRAVTLCGAQGLVTIGR